MVIGRPGALDPLIVLFAVEDVNEGAALLLTHVSRGVLEAEPADLVVRVGATEKSGILGSSARSEGGCDEIEGHLGETLGGIIASIIIISGVGIATSEH